ncbi:hypothetical protein [Kordiimonas sp. SCSIO 12610]|uniref:hypothetical protein n=1 Tax=Kordiimonas sp. SCSIO 12610 TaxID=2829597 RepID=UPI00210E4ACF|nr:hypothetical protein [Kordiimonas sp. SCSIO 12610]UTW54515.1 hypothetical protein KFF44_11965 [Kordiimonas sp. SCSIO 12610]
MMLKFIAIWIADINVLESVNIMEKQIIIVMLAMLLGVLSIFAAKRIFGTKRKDLSNYAVIMGLVGVVLMLGSLMLG